MNDLLKNISIVLVQTKTSSNIGAAARAMNCMGLSDLILAEPRCQIDKNAFSLASGSEHILENSRIYYDLKEALQDFSLVVGTTRRQGKKRHNFITPRQLSSEIFPMYSNIKAAILFGSEDYGLSLEHFKECQYLVYIPVSENFGSLNLAQAVMVITYELRASLEAGKHKKSITDIASQEELAILSKVFADTFEKVRFPNKQNSVNPASKLMEICARANLSKYEVKLLLSFARHADYMSGKSEVIL